jgi:hypothetical protein
MGEINIPRNERDALKAVDTAELNRLIDQCFYEEQPAALRILRLESCGPYIASRLREYENALAERCKAKAAKKRAETESRVRHAGSALEHAVAQMKHRVDKEEKEGLLFYVEDQIMPPHRFSEHMTVRVTYRWRRAIEDEWVHGSITFSHDVDTRPDYTVPIPKRKPSAAKQEQDRQDRLYREWEHLKMLGLDSVKDYLREGGNGAEIPQAFQANTDSYTRGLNNYSAQFEPVRS